jgi:uncharacterized protein (DUF1330 family)
MICSDCYVLAIQRVSGCRSPSRQGSFVRPSIPKQKEQAMAVYLLGALKIHNQEWMTDYQSNVPAIMQRHGGEYLALSDTIKRHDGAGRDPDVLFLATFPSMAAIDAFYSDAEYRPYRAARLAATDSASFAFSTRG